ncbi:kynureninase [Pacificispira sp.]|uniref:kynureninase n=1 Tax=Pacificispira sp. TaxID=2888761 RepID=UPI003BA9BAF9
MADAVSDLRDRAQDLDLADGLAARADLFDLPRGVIYLDGNSLGPPPRGVMDRLTRVAGQEWGVDLITSWNKNGWMGFGARIGARIAALVGAAPESIRACDSTSVNLLKVLSAALSLRPGRRIVISERGNFPTDLYVAQRLLEELGGGYALRLIDDAETDLDDALDADVAVVMLTQTDYRSGRKLNMRRVSDAIHQAGALALWDLAHSAGAFEVNLDADGADFAVGCGYKFLNGGPGAPAFVYAAESHRETARPILAGWLGHAAPFDFRPDYEPAPGMDRYVIGTPPVLSMAALETALEAYDGVDGRMIEAKTAGLGDFFIDCVEALVPDEAGLLLASPRDRTRRGAQVSFRHSEGYAVMQALIARGVIGDFRAPDIVRFGFSPLYLTYGAVLDAAVILAEIFTTHEWDRPEYKTRAAVT